MVGWRPEAWDELGGRLPTNNHWSLFIAPRQNFCLLVRKLFQSPINAMQLAGALAARWRS